ncbi:iron-containing alcohol dehydrogenase, partial [Candidatus Roizmanbacteria bacterium]|nr:iron-containing alcohol dehydrogenase [Candidatus Roizmanbacteria bacterium]
MKKNNQLFIGRSLLKKMGKFIPVGNYSKIGILTDEIIARHWLQVIERGLGKKVIPIIIPPGEKMKTINQVIEIWKRMMNEGFDRHSLLINLGGGVIGDIGGFAASTFMRGIDFINIPTTLLAMVDASIGGKTGID